MSFVSSVCCIVLIPLLRTFYIIYHIFYILYFYSIEPIRGPDMTAYGSIDPVNKESLFL
jgi:hypothetical protein